jgi:sugar/nucleoside kinase (ribokinase family)
MSDIWASLLKELCPGLSGPRRKIFFDLADPEKRTPQDITKALELIAGFQPYFDVILGLNEKEASEISAVMGLTHRPHTPEGLSETACEINSRLHLSTLVVHPVAFAVAVSDGNASVVSGPVVAKPLITTGAGDHFNSGFCLGKLVGLDNRLATLTGVTTSGYYVRTGQSPTVTQLAGMLRNWPKK